MERERLVAKRDKFRRIRTFEGTRGGRGKCFVGGLGGDIILCERQGRS
ncbi:MAG TPA: hypothetical protein VMW16_16115 [Sedimentisphaerales bacterium]|nr:hypothetical protein [Sedimentisphaerales bacterium]